MTSGRDGAANLSMASELLREASGKGAELTVPTGKAHWSVLTRARAVEALAYVVAAAQWGDHDSGRTTYGHSMIVDPWGVIIVERDAGAGVIMADLDMMALQQLRERFPALQHRRQL